MIPLYRPMLIALLAGGPLILGASGCKKTPPPPPATQNTGSTMATATGQTGSAAGQGITGRVVETMDAAGYTYLKLRTAQGEVWAAVRKTQVAVGQSVTLGRAQPMKNFKSRSLNRTFPLIYFASLARGGAGHGAKSPQGRMGGSTAHGKAQPKRATFDKPLAKAPGPNGHTVAQVFAQRKTLAGKTVTVRGKVMKFSGKIMGKHWLHLQDGTGGTDGFDLTVTTQQQAKVGDVVLVTGTVKADVSLGAGYRYKVLVEKATLKADAPASK